MKINKLRKMTFANVMLNVLTIVHKFNLEQKDYLSFILKKINIWLKLMNSKIILANNHAKKIYKNLVVKW